MAIDIGRVGFEAYTASVGGRTYDGYAIPKWEALGQRIQNAWREAGVAVLQAMPPLPNDTDIIS
jgi:hypothetical protein